MSTELIERIPPQAINVEYLVIASLIEVEACRDDAMEKLTEHHFYSTLHKKIFKTINSLFIKNETIDIITVSNKMNDDPAFNISDFVGQDTRRNIIPHVAILTEKMILRKIIETSSRALNRAFEGEESASDVLNDTQKEIFAIDDGKAQESSATVCQILPTVFTQISSYKAGEISGLRTGFYDIDLLMAGLNPGLIILAGRPSMGKTALAVQIAAHIAKHSQVVMYSLEMGKDQLTMRMLCSDAEVSMHLLRIGRASQSNIVALNVAAGPLSEAKMIIDDKPATTPSYILSSSRRIKRASGLSLIVIDYLQLMNAMSNRKTENKQQDVSDITRFLKGISKELDVPVLALSQLSRGVEMRQDKRPMLSDLRDSGAIEQDADEVLFIYRDEFYNPETEDKNIAEIIIGKQRNGPTGTVKVYMDKPTMKFANLSKEYQRKEF